MTRTRRERYLQLLLMLILPIFLVGCGGQDSDFGIAFGLGQTSNVNVPPGKTVSLVLAINFVDGNPGDITILFQGLPYGVVAAPNTFTTTAVARTLPAFQLNAGPGAPQTGAATSALIVAKAGSIVHTLTLNVTTNPEQ